MVHFEWPLTLPKGLHSVRYCGFHHPTAKKTLHKMQLYSGQPTATAATTKNKEPSTKNNPPTCPCCNAPMERIGSIPPERSRFEQMLSALMRVRGPPSKAATA